LSLEPSSQSAIFKITQTAAHQMLASLLDLFALFATTQMPLYKAWDVQRKERKAVAAGSKNDNNFIDRHKQLNFNILNNVK